MVGCRRRCGRRRRWRGNLEEVEANVVVAVRRVETFLGQRDVDDEAKRRPFGRGLRWESLMHLVLQPDSPMALRLVVGEQHEGRLRARGDVRFEEGQGVPELAPLCRTTGRRAHALVMEALFELADQCFEDHPATPETRRMPARSSGAMLTSRRGRGRGSSLGPAPQVLPRREDAEVAVAAPAPSWYPPG